MAALSLTLSLSHSVSLSLSGLNLFFFVLCEHARLGYSLGALAILWMGKSLLLATFPYAVIWTAFSVNTAKKKTLQADKDLGCTGGPCPHLPPPMDSPIHVIVATRTSVKFKRKESTKHGSLCVASLPSMPLLFLTGPITGGPPVWGESETYWIATMHTAYCSVDSYYIKLGYIIETPF